MLNVTMDESLILLLIKTTYLIVVQNQIDISKDPPIVKIVAGSNQKIWPLNGHLQCNWSQNQKHDCAVGELLTHGATSTNFPGV